VLPFTFQINAILCFFVIITVVHGGETRGKGHKLKHQGVQMDRDSQVLEQAAQRGWAVSVLGCLPG